MRALAEANDLKYWRAVASTYADWARVRLMEPRAEAFRAGLGAYAELGAKLQEAVVSPLLADVELAVGRRDDALAAVERGLALAAETGAPGIRPWLLRLGGDALAETDPAAAASAYRDALSVAGAQGSRALSLLAALALARLLRSTGQPVEAQAVLSDALEGFEPTPLFPAIAEAQALLAALAETDEVKAAVARRERRVKLQTAYGRALMWTKGFGSEEAKDAFARAREMSGGTDDAAERFSAYYAQFVRSYVRAEWPQARATAETFLREAEEGAYAMEACAARRCLGTARLFQSDLREARALLKQALADHAPDRDALTRFRFGLDTGVMAAAHLALAMWRLGEAGRARQLAEQAIQRSAELGHAPTSAAMYSLVAQLDVERNEPAAVLRSAEMAHALGREHGMDLFVAFGEVFGGWARGQLHDAEVGAQELRRALADYFDQGNKAWAPMLHGMLAQLEAATRGPDAALTVINQALAIAAETGERFTDPYLHRLRGDILLKSNPADPSPAEDSYRTAVMIAKQQGARSYELLASLSLAKLYQSTDRPVDAHAVLAPALEGFSPTPEMPEIAEASALMERLA
jgi:tetratricopeptide (TPR) repeat protein